MKKTMMIAGAALGALCLASCQSLATGGLLYKSVDSEQCDELEDASEASRCRLDDLTSRSNRPGWQVWSRSTDRDAS